MVFGGEIPSTLNSGKSRTTEGRAFSQKRLDGKTYVVQDARVLKKGKKGGIRHLGGDIGDPSSQLGYLSERKQLRWFAEEDKEE